MGHDKQDIYKGLSYDVLIESIIAETYYPSAEKVLIIKDYLDKNFRKVVLDDIDDNGYPVQCNAVSMLNSKKQSVKTLQIKEFLMLLDDKFHNMIADDCDRREFLKQVIIDWFTNSIDKNGLLSVNFVN